MVTEKQGSFVNWEGRVQNFAAVTHTTTVLSDARVLADLATAMSVSSFPSTVTALRREMQSLGAHAGTRAVAPTFAAAAGGDGVRLASWHELLDAGVMQEGEPYLAATARPVVARISTATAAAFGLADGDEATIEANGASLDISVAVTAGMVDGCVWLPSNAPDCNPSAMLSVRAGDRVSVSRKAGA